LRKGEWSYAGEPDAPGLDVEVLEIVDEAGGKVVGDAVDEDLVSRWLLAEVQRSTIHLALLLTLDPQS